MSERSLSWALLGSPVILGVGIAVALLVPGGDAPVVAQPAGIDAPPLGSLTAAGPRAAARGARAVPSPDPLRQLTGRCLAAIRKTTRLAPRDFAAAGFRPIPRATPGDWRLGPGRDETHQSFFRYTRSEPNGSKGRRRVLVLRRVGTCPPHMRGTLPPLRRFMELYFQRPVEWGPRLPFPTGGRERRFAGRTWRQYLTTPILKTLRARVPGNAVAVLGVSCQDLYPEPSWNFVFGMATFHARVGVYSLARLFPSFDGLGHTADSALVALRRSLMILAHETGHMFGVEHCVTFHCVMNGTNSLDESDRAPLHLCPACLSKLAWNLRFDVVTRYRRLAAFLARHGLTGEAAWYRRQVRRLTKPRRPPEPPARADAGAPRAAATAPARR